MRKFIFSSTMLSAIFGGLGTIKATQNGPRDWRLLLMWISWGLALAIAAGTVIKNAETHELEE